MIYQQVYQLRREMYRPAQRGWGGQCHAHKETSQSDIMMDVDVNEWKPVGQIIMSTGLLPKRPAKQQWHDDLFHLTVLVLPNLATMNADQAGKILRDIIPGTKIVLRIGRCIVVASLHGICVICTKGARYTPSELSGAGIVTAIKVSHLDILAHPEFGGKHLDENGNLVEHETGI